MYFKKLIGKKCYLSPINEEDVEKFTEWVNDLDVIIGNSFFHGVRNTAKIKEEFAIVSKTHNYAIIDIENNEPIGHCGFNNIDHLNQTGETGIMIGEKNYWDKGYGTEALILLMDYGFKALNLHNINLWTYSFNERALKSFKNIGFKEIGKKREALLRGSKRYDIIYMDILSNEFYEANK
jgi:RimJ/RimL family protein N-acetyltransferase